MEERVEYKGKVLLNNFARCCATCEDRPFTSGYSGTKNCGKCLKVGMIVHRASVCKRYKRDYKVNSNLLGSMKSQSKWL